jgi:hypothetical protein
MVLPQAGDRMQLSRPSAEQIARETRNAAAAAEAARVWRRHVRVVVVAVFASMAVATLIGAAAFAVDGARLGVALLALGRAGVVLFPFVIIVVWIVEVHRRGDL